MKTKSSQAAFEFLILTGVMMVIFVMFFAIAGSRIIEMTEARRDKVAQDIIDAVMAELELAHESMDGYTRNFTLPKTVEGGEYEIGIHNIGEGKNLFILLYSDKIFNYEIPLNIITGSRIYKGNNMVQKSKDGIFVISGEDPCRDIILGDKNYCLGGHCYCYSGYYVHGTEFGSTDNTCEHENDFDMPGDKCDKGCVDFDFCNPPPGILPGNEGTVEPTDVTDTTAILQFAANESATAVIKYGEYADCGWEDMVKERYEERLMKDFAVLLTDMHAVTEYCFAIEVTDQKGASQIYDSTKIILPNTFTTKGDVSAPLVRYASVYPSLSESEPYHLYDQEVEIFVNVTDDTADIDDNDYVKAIIKQKQEGGSEIEIKVLEDFEDKEEECDNSPARDVYDDDGYMQCFQTDNEFARYASYSLDGFTLFYARYDSVFEPDNSAAGTLTTKVNLLDTVDIVSARFGNGTRMDANEKLSYNAFSHEARKNFDTEEGTIEFWFKPVANVGSEQYFFYLDDEAGENVFSLYRFGNTIVFSIKSPSGSWSVNSGTLALSTGSWYFIAITWDNIGEDDGEMHMYFDGVERGVPQSDVNDFSVGAGRNFYVGSYPTRTPEIPNAANAHAIIDQFRILDKAKQVEQIIADYDITRTYVIYFETKDRDYERTYTPGQYDGTSSFPVNYGT